MFCIGDYVYKKRKFLKITYLNTLQYQIINVYCVNGLFYYKLSDNSIKRDTDLIFISHNKINYDLFTIGG